MRISADWYKGPKDKSEAKPLVIMGPLVKSGLPPHAFERDPKLEAALERLLRAAGIAGDGSGEGGARFGCLPSVRPSSTP
jgi:hypothetical protein